MLTDVEPKGLIVALKGEPESQAIPEVVLAVTEYDSDPPPALETETDCARATDCRTKANVSEVGFTFKLGWPGAVVVSATRMVRADGFATGELIIMVP
jgi:hypothetical protein